MKNISRNLSQHQPSQIMGSRLPKLNALVTLEMSPSQWVHKATDIWNALIYHGFTTARFEIFNTSSQSKPATLLDPSDVLTNNCLWISDYQTGKSHQVDSLMTIAVGLEKIAKAEGDTAFRVTNGNFQNYPGYPKTRGWMIEDAEKIVLSGTFGEWRPDLI